MKIKNLKLPLIYMGGVLVDADGNTILKVNRDSSTTPLVPSERDQLLKDVADLVNAHSRKINDVDQAKEVLKKAGYLVGSLFQLEDIISRVKDYTEDDEGGPVTLTEEQAREVADELESNSDANWDSIDEAYNEWKTDYASMPELKG